MLELCREWLAGINLANIVSPTVCGADDQTPLSFYLATFPLVAENRTEINIRRPIHSIQKMFIFIPTVLNKLITLLNPCKMSLTSS